MCIPAAACDLAMVEPAEGENPLATSYHFNPSLVQTFQGIGKSAKKGKFFSFIRCTG